MVIFNLAVSRLLAGLTITRDEIIAKGHSGFCVGCGICHYPNCAFGK